MEQYEKALEYYEWSLKIWLETDGEHHLDTSTTFNNIGLTYDKMGK